MHAARRRRLRRRADADAGRDGGDGRLVVRLASARPAALPDLASARRIGPTASSSPRPRGARRTGGRSTIPSRTSAPASSTRGSRSARRRELGFSTDALDDPRVGTIVCGLVGDDRLHVRHSVMAHVWLRDGDGLVLRSRFWLGAVLRPDLPGPLGAAGARAAQPAGRRAAARCPPASRGSSRATAPRSTRTSRRCCRSCTRGTPLAPRHSGLSARHGARGTAPGTSGSRARLRMGRWSRPSA